MRSLTPRPRPIPKSRYNLNHDGNFTAKKVLLDKDYNNKKITLIEYREKLNDLN